ncbi:unnamed protein product [Adineta ricciae]|uniref:Uncharacterized protein n=1 Tax=Adineta ricciae TaxID=249248 RepID=A0A815P2R7_ADIRI|nr:unnamed protein product [Adineta ricciae]
MVTNFGSEIETFISSAATRVHCEDATCNNGRSDRDGMEWKQMICGRIIDCYRDCITAVINKKVPNGVHKLVSILAVHNTVMLINMLLLSLMIVAIVIRCLLQHCRSTAVEIGIVDEPPTYSIDTPASAKKSPEKNEDGYKV